MQIAAGLDIWAEWEFKRFNYVRPALTIWLDRGPTSGVPGLARDLDLLLMPGARRCASKPIPVRLLLLRSNPCSPFNDPHWAGRLPSMVIGRCTCTTRWTNSACRTPCCS